MTVALKPFSWENARQLAQTVEAYFSQKGIFIDLSDKANLHDDKTTDAESGGALSGNLTLDNFLISPEKAAPAFFLQLNGIGDIGQCMERLAMDLEKLHSAIADYAEQNNLEEDVRKKITLINTHVSRAKGALSSRGKKLVNDCREKNSVEEQRREAASVISKVFKERLLEGAMDPIYEERKNVYGFVLRKLNEFLASWGAQTLSLNAGEPMNYDLPCDLLPGSEAGTAEQHDTIREIHRLPYVWNDGLEDKLPLWNGLVSVWR